MESDTQVGGIVKSDNRKMRTNKTSSRIFLVTILAIPIIHWLVFWFYVNVQSIALAFMHVRTGEFTWINFKTFWDSLTSPIGNTIGVAVKNTFLFFGLHILVTMPLSLVIAFFLYKRILGYKFFRVMFYMPAIISAVAMTAAFKEFIAPNGPLGRIVKFFGGEIPYEGMLNNFKYATVAIIIYCIWTGFTRDVLLFGGGMSRIPIEVLESAKLEGCGPGNEILKIVLPLIWPTVSTQIVFIFTGMFGAGGPILLLTNGSYNTTTVAFWIFQQVYGDGSVGGSGIYNNVSCAGLCFTLVGVPVILFIKWLMGKVDSVEY